VLNRIRYSKTHTNTDTGEWFTIRRHSTFNEVQVTRIEGTVFSFRAIEAGQPFLVDDSDGNLVARDSGSVHVTYLFDTEGDDVPGGIFVADVDEPHQRPAPHLGQRSV
jgi:hypothetical protein